MTGIGTPSSHNRIPLPNGPLLPVRSQMKRDDAREVPAKFFRRDRERLPDLEKLKSSPSEPLCDGFGAVFCLAPETRSSLVRPQENFSSCSKWSCGYLEAAARRLYRNWQLVTERGGGWRSGRADWSLEASNQAHYTNAVHLHVTRGPDPEKK